MKRLVLLTIIFVLLLMSSVFAYEINIESYDNNQIVLSISDLNNVDFKISDLKATVSTATVSDTYLVDKKLSVENNKIIITIDTSPVFQDYPSSEIEELTISGYIEFEGVKEEFANKILYRPSSNVLSAPSLESSTLIYWVTGLAVLFVVVILFYIFKKPKKKVKRKKKKSKKKKKI